MASSISAASRTLRVIGPPTSMLCDSGTRPSCDTSPTEDRTPTSPLFDGGSRMDAQVSEPVPRTAKLAAMAAAVPPLEPPASMAVL